MAVAVFDAKHAKDFWDKARSSVLKYFGISRSRLQPKHNIVYLDRQDTQRRLSNRDHDALVHTLGSIAAKTGATFTHLELKNMTIVDTIKVVSQATVSSCTGRS